MTTTNDDHTQEVTDSFTLFDQNTSTYNSERGNTDRKLLGITFDNDLFRGRIDYCNLLLFNSGTSTHYTMENHREQNETDFVTAENSQLSAPRCPSLKSNIKIRAKCERPHAGYNARFKNCGERRKRMTYHLFTNTNDPIVGKHSIIYRLPLTGKHIYLNIDAKALTDPSSASTV
ncbi:hypothetical protein LOAG_09982 [Loa loa]|uniref:Uncharacterized protein n=1 Tax=Loa loa TaxID=7209 RepID=A0A1S0TSC6_LOALO|nr:hypothetical protein LOAG_09982 [Loa loa]EFO18515.1 hypothetical protein LOAG_09982 [Loa loa]